MENLSYHAAVRCEERRIPVDHIQTVLSFAKPIYRTGIVFYYLSKKDIPEELQNDKNFQRLIGLTILEGRDGEIITTYCNKSKNALKQIKKKSKQRRLCA